MATKTTRTADTMDEGASTGRRSAWWLLAGLAVVLVVQVVLLVAVLGTNSDVADLRDEVAALGTTPALNPDEIPDLGTGQSSPAPSVAPTSGNLPRFQGGGADAALGRNVGQLSGLEYYSGQNAVFAPSDGVARAYMIWAHWCPYCQEELPEVAQWQNESAASLENFELVTVTTAMDDTASNPLVPYLDGSEFPFPVLVDEDGSLSRQLGVNAFPFWVFVAPDGTVVGRAAGAIGVENLDTVFRQLDELEPIAAADS